MVSKVLKPDHNISPVPRIAIIKYKINFYCSWQGAVVCDAMQVWEVQWMQSNLEAVRILTDADFAVMFRSTRFVRNCVVTIQSLMKVLVC